MIIPTHIFTRQWQWWYKQIILDGKLTPPLVAPRPISIQCHNPHPNCQRQKLAPEHGVACWWIIAVGLKLTLYILASRDASCVAAEESAMTILERELLPSRDGIATDIEPVLCNKLKTTQSKITERIILTNPNEQTPR